MAGHELYLYGSVGASWWGDDYFTAGTVRAALEGRSGELTVRINSGGGSAIEGQAIYTLLKDYPDKVTVVVDGVAASAASLIAMAGDDIVMRLGSWMLIHDPAQPWTEGRGTEDDHLREAEVLGVIGNAYAEIYAARSGLTRDEAREIMRVETVLNGEMAVEKGFATRTETTEAAPEAAFDYRIYANAPQHLRDQAEKLGPVPNKRAIAAMFAGKPRVTPKKEPMMAPNDQKPVEASSAVPAPAPAPAKPVGQTTITPEAAVAAERDRVKRINTAARIAGVADDVVTALIDEGVSVEIALDRISAAWQAKGDIDKPMHGAPVARTNIIRDERDTARAGMTGAIYAQIARKSDVDGPARNYMALSIVEMAALATGERSSLRSPADRQRVLEMAFHTTSDFPIVLENALNKRLMDQYEMQAPTYRSIATQMDFNDFRPHPVSQLSDFPLLREVNENGEINFGTLSEKKETVVLKSYAAGLRLSRQALINDDLGAIDRAVRNTALAVAATEDQVFYAMMLSASGAGPTLTETTRAVFNTTDGTLAGTAAAITVASLALGRAAMRKRKRLDGTDLEAVARILLVGPDKETEAQQIVAPIQAQQAGNVNPFAGTLSIVTTAKITGNAWYLFADPNTLPTFMYGFLSGDAGPRVRMEEPFGMQGTAYTVERDFGCGPVDWRGGYRNAGA